MIFFKMLQTKFESSHCVAYPSIQWVHWPRLIHCMMTVIPTAQLPPSFLQVNRVKPVTSGLLDTSFHVTSTSRWSPETFVLFSIDTMNSSGAMTENEM